jgi:hypothetical protein
MIDSSNATDETIPGGPFVLGTDRRPPECGGDKVNVCPNLKCTHEGFDGERYRCEVCGESYFLSYDDMSDLPDDRREVVKRLVAILEPLAPPERFALIERYWAREAGEARFREIFTAPWRK